DLATHFSCNGRDIIDFLLDIMRGRSAAFAASAPIISSHPEALVHQHCAHSGAWPQLSKAEGPIYQHDRGPAACNLIGDGTAITVRGYSGMLQHLQPSGL